MREALADLDSRCQKIVSGLFAVMIRQPEKVRDREWVCERLAEITLLAGDFEADTPDMGASVVERYLTSHSEKLLSASYMLFQRVGLDLAPRAKDGLRYEDAMCRALAYLPDAASVD